MHQETFSLQKLLINLKSSFNLTPFIGAELEFYLLGLKSDEQLLALQKQIPLAIKKEKGRNQYEIDLKPSNQILSYPDLICKNRELIIKEAKKQGLTASFEPKVFLDDFGNSMHIHLNFLEDLENEKYANILCHYLPETIDSFLPNKSDYLRLDSKFMAPTHICYGGNNRTVLIRIPNSLPKRIEHRLSSANADPHKVIYAILYSIYKGLSNPGEVRNFEKIYGNAYDKQYNLALIVA